MRRAVPIVLTLLALLAVVLWRNMSAGELPPPVGGEPAGQVPGAPPSAEPTAGAAVGDLVDELEGDDFATIERLAEPDAMAPDAGGYRLRLDGPAEWCNGIPLAMVWVVEPDSNAALQSVQPSDAHGGAAFPLMQTTTPAAWYWADLGFPTLGLAAAQVPVDGGEAVLPMVMPAFVDVEVVDPAGVADATFVEVRCPGAREPGQRWHRYRCERTDDGVGRAALLVEAGVALELRVRTRSGRFVEQRLQVPVEPEARAACRVELAAEGVVRLPLLGPDLAPLADASVRLLRCDRWQVLPDCTRSDADGRIAFWPPADLRGGWTAELLVTVERDGVELAASVLLDHVALQGGAELAAVTLQPSPELAAGRVVDARGRANADIVVRLEVGLMLPGKHADGDGLTWRMVGQRRSDADGAFAFHGSVPPGLRLRLCLPAVHDGRVFDIRRGQRGVELEARRPLRPFGR